MPAPPPSAPRQVPRLFALWRREDVNGQSGTGLIAHGVRWPGGQVVTWWAESKVAVHQVTMWTSLTELLKVHGHGGRTSVVWLSAEPDDRLIDTAPLRARWDGYQAKLDAKGLARYEAAAELAPQLLSLIEAYERLAAAFLEQGQALTDTRAEADALHTALAVTSSLVPKQEEAR